MADAEEESDERLMVRVREQDHQAFAMLVRRHTDRFYATAFRMCGQQEEAEDIVQEAFLKLWDRPESWDASKGAKFTTWFYRVVTNQALDRLRKRKNSYGTEVVERLVDPSKDQQREMEDSQEQKYIEAAIQALPERQKAALNLCFYEGLSNKEAAEALGVGIKALESLLMRAKAGLRDELTRRGLIRRKEDYG